MALKYHDPRKHPLRRSIQIALTVATALALVSMDDTACAWVRNQVQAGFHAAPPPTAPHTPSYCWAADGEPMQGLALPCAVRLADQVIEL